MDENNEKKELQLDFLKFFSNNNTQEPQNNRSSDKIIPFRPKQSLRDEPRYENMHAKNIRVSSNGYKCMSRALKRNKKFILLISTALTIGLGVIGYHHISDKEEQPVIEEVIESDDDMIISPSDNSICNLSNISVVIRRGTSSNEVYNIANTANRELTEMGVDSKVIADSDDIVEEVNNIKSPGIDVAVINIDDEANKDDSLDVVVLKNYNEDKMSSSSALAIGMGSEAEGFGYSNSIRSGQAEYDGGRCQTNVEKTLFDAGVYDVMCLTVAPSTIYLESDETHCNDLATSIANSVVRLGTLPYGERDSKILVEANSSFSGISEEYGVEVSDLKSMNKEYSDTILPGGATIRIAPIPEGLKKETIVDNPTVTTDFMDTKTEVSYYIVQEGDTITGISEQIHVDPSELIINGHYIDQNDENYGNIKVGDNIGYLTTTGPVLISKPQVNTK